MNAHRICKNCSGKVTAWLFGKEIYRVTGQKDKFGEVAEFICNECRFEKKEVNDWVIEGPRHIERHSVISQNHYEKIVQQSIINPLKETTEPQE
jgi:NADH-quinone oxidoreductase subunit G